MKSRRLTRAVFRGAFCALAFALAACGDKPAPPKPVTQPTPPTPVSQSAPAPVAAAAPAVPEPAKADPNAELAARVKSALEGHKLQAAGIDVSAADGKVTLWGTVATRGERERAAKLASGVQGVKGVDNKLQIVKGS